MANKVFINKEGIIEEVYIGRQTFETINRTAASAMKLTDKLLENKDKGFVRILINLKNIKSISAAAVLASADAINSMKNAKMALFGGEKLPNDLANFIITALGREETIQIFDRRKDAEKWLKKRTR